MEEGGTTVSTTRWIIETPCEHCDGEGEWSQPRPLAGYGSEYMDCPYCKGSGQRPRMKPEARWMWTSWMIGVMWNWDHLGHSITIRIGPLLLGVHDYDDGYA